MAYVAPQGTIELYVNVPFDVSYRHTMYFANESAQRAFLESKLLQRYSNQMYTRVHRNRVRINSKADEIQSASYLGFKNLTNGKWYYAFVTKVNYVNEQVTDVDYIIDEIQTWLFDIVWNQCFIERQHSSTDIRGENLQPEPVSCNEYIGIEHTTLMYLTNVNYILSLGTVNATNTGTLSSYNKFSGIGATVKYLYFSDENELINFLNACEFEDGAISGLLNTGDLWKPLTLYAVPSRLFNRGSQVSTLVGTVNVLADTITIIDSNSLHRIPLPSYHGNSYIPKNNKLLTYPYMKLAMEFGTKIQDYKYESFSIGNNVQPSFILYGTCNPEPSYLIIPRNYNGNDNDFDYGMTIEDFPQLQIYSSGYWGAAGNSIATIIKMAITALIGGVGAIASGIQTTKPDSEWNEKNMQTGKMQDVTQPSEAILNSIKSMEIPQFTVGNKISSGGGVNSMAPLLAYLSNTSGGSGVTGGFNISAIQYGLREEYAKRIDEFFSKYGYAQNKVSTPNIHARANWTYVKTRDCNISGAIPSESRNIISSAMNNGITWWTGNTTPCEYYNTSTDSLISNPTL